MENSCNKFNNMIIIIARLWNFPLWMAHNNKQQKKLSLSIIFSSPNQKHSGRTAEEVKMKKRIEKN